MGESARIIITIEYDNPVGSVACRLEDFDPDTATFEYGIRVASAHKAVAEVASLIMGKTPDLDSLAVAALINKAVKPLTESMPGLSDLVTSMLSGFTSNKSDSDDDEDCAHCPSELCPIRKEPYVGEDKSDDEDQPSTEETVDNLPDDIVDQINDAINKKKDD